MAYAKDSTMRDRTFDRLKKSIAGEPTDRHAVFLYYTYPFFQNVTGMDLMEYYHNPKFMMEIQQEVFGMLDNCGSFQPDTGAVAECSGLGGEIQFDPHGFISVKKMEIDTLEDAMAVKPGDPWGDNYMRRGLETFQYMLEHAPENIKVNPPMIHGPFTVAAQLRGISQLCEDTILEPEIVEALLDAATETSIRYMKEAEKIMGKPLHHILVGDDVSAFLSKNQYREWILPTYEKIFKEFPNSQRWLHNDANAAHLFAEIKDGGWDAWQYAPSIDPMEALEGSEGKVTLMGGLNPVELQKLTPEETYGKCMEVLKSFKGNSKLVLGPGGSVNQIPVENLKAIFRAADDFEICEGKK